MHAIIWFLLSQIAFASESPPTLEVVRTRHHGKEVTQIFQKGQEWYCVTEANKRFFLAKAPESIALVPTEKSAGNCKEELAVIYREKKKQSWKGCREEAKEFYDTLYRECGRN